MKTVLALAVLTVIATITDSSVIPSYVTSDLSDVPSNVISDYSDESSHESIIEYTEVIDSSKSDVHLIPSTWSDDSPSVATALSADPLAVYPSGSSDFDILPPLSRTNRQWGTISSSDRRLLLVNVNRAAIANTIQRQTIEFRRANNAIIRAARAMQTRANQGASVAVTAGGVGRSFMAITITSRRGGSIFYQVDFWGR